MFTFIINNGDIGWLWSYFSWNNQWQNILHILLSNWHTPTVGIHDTGNSPGHAISFDEIDLFPDWWLDGRNIPLALQSDPVQMVQSQAEGLWASPRSWQEVQRTGLWWGRKGALHAHWPSYGSNHCQSHSNLLLHIHWCPRICCLGGLDANCLSLFLLYNTYDNRVISSKEYFILSVKEINNICFQIWRLVSTESFLWIWSRSNCCNENVFYISILHIW